MDNQFRDKLLLDLNANQKAMTVMMDEMKDDLKEHIKRSNQNELMIKQTEEKMYQEISFVKKHIYFVQGAVGLITILSVVVGLLIKLKII